MTLTRPQKTILHVAASKLKLDDETYRAVLVKIAGVTTSNDLDQAGFEAVMGFADYCGFRPLAKGAPRYGNRPGMATYAQLELIRELWRELHDQATCDDEGAHRLASETPQGQLHALPHPGRGAQGDHCPESMEGPAKVQGRVTDFDSPRRGGAGRCRPSLFSPAPNTPENGPWRGLACFRPPTLTKPTDPV